MPFNARVVLVVVTLLVIVIYYIPLGHTSFADVWGEGTYGIQLSPQGGTTVLACDPGSPGWNAGIRAGDRIVTGPFSLVPTLVSFPYPGDRVTIEYDDLRGGGHTATLKATTVANFDWWQRTAGILAIIPATIFLVIAFILVYLRPGIMTWSFYAYAIGYFSTGPVAMYYLHVLPPPAYLALISVMSTLFGNFAVMPLLPFVLRFPTDDLRGWRKKADVFIWLLLGFSFAAYVYEWFHQRATGLPLSWGVVLDTWLPLATFAIATAIMLKNYKVASPEVRQRTGFLVIGVLISFIAYAIYFIPEIPQAVVQVIGYLVVLMPIAVAYAVLRVRVLDVNFVLNRAIAYALLSVVVLIVVSILDWGSGQIVSRVHFATFIEIVVTVLIGFGLSRVNSTFEGWVDVLLFRRRHEAERYLRRAAAALPYATGEEAITDGLVHEPVEALDLTAAALYRRSEDGSRFAGIGTSSQTAVAPMGFDRDHPLVRFLKADEEVVWLQDVRAHLDPENSAIYVLAVPVAVRHELVSFVLYGAHTNGSQIDPEEVALIKDLAREAARAYDHVEAVRTRELMGRFTAIPARTS